MPGSLPLTSPRRPPARASPAPTVTVTGTTAPGATVDAEGAGPTGGTAGHGLDDGGRDAATGRCRCRPASAPTTITVDRDARATAPATPSSSVIDVALPGTTVLSVTDPTGDDNGPGPTIPDGLVVRARCVRPDRAEGQPDRDRRLHPGQDPQPDPTFGNSFGAQLLDVYVHNPSATALDRGRLPVSVNYTIAPADAWSERLEAQGFAPVDLGGRLRALARAPPSWSPMTPAGRRR